MPVSNQDPEFPLAYVGADYSCMKIDILVKEQSRYKKQDLKQNTGSENLKIIFLKQTRIDFRIFCC